MASMEHTQYFGKNQLTESNVRETLLLVYSALKEKGYEPDDQLVGYLLSGDPVYITSHKEARRLVQAFTRDEIIEVLLKSFLKGESI